MKDKKVIEKFTNQQSKWTDKAKDFLSKDQFDELKNNVFTKMANGNDKIKQSYGTIKQFIGMITDFFKNDFLIDKSEVLLIIGGLIYFLTPIDIVPDFIPGVGLLDDIAVLGFIAQRLVGTLTQYEEYKRDFEIKDDDIEIIEAEVVEDDSN